MGMSRPEDWDKWKKKYPWVEQASIFTASVRVYHDGPARTGGCGCCWLQLRSRPSCRGRGRGAVVLDVTAVLQSCLGEQKGSGQGSCSRALIPKMDSSVDGPAFFCLARVPEKPEDCVDSVRGELACMQPRRHSLQDQKGERKRLDGREPVALWGPIVLFVSLLLFSPSRTLVAALVTIQRQQKRRKKGPRASSRRQTELIAVGRSARASAGRQGFRASVVAVVARLIMQHSQRLSLVGRGNCNYSIISLGAAMGSANLLQVCKGERPIAAQVRFVAGVRQRER